MNTLAQLHRYLVDQQGLGTFLKFEISMDGTPSATYSHGFIQFNDMALEEKDDRKEL
jgi:hypothetical protein